MTELKWRLSREQLKALREIHANCAQNYISCNVCPLYFSEVYKDLTSWHCRIGGAINPEDWELSGSSPQSWKLDKMRRPEIEKEN